MVFGLDEWIDELNAVEGTRSAHVFGVKNSDSSFFACAEDHAVPVRKAETRRQIECVIQDGRNRENQGKKISENAHMLSEFGVSQLALVTPAPHLCDRLCQHLPEQYG